MKRTFLFLLVCFFLGVGNEISLSSATPELSADSRSMDDARKVMPKGKIVLKNKDWAELMAAYEDLDRLNLRKNEEIVLSKLNAIWDVYKRNPDVFVLFFESINYGYIDRLPDMRMRNGRDVVVGYYGLLTVSKSIDKMHHRRKIEVSRLVFEFFKFKEGVDSLYFEKKEDGAVQYDYWLVQMQGSFESVPLVGDFLRAFFIKKPSGERASNKIEAEGFISLYEKRWMTLEESYEALIELDISQKKNGPLVDYQLAKILDVFERGENMFILFFQSINLNCNGGFYVSEKIDKADVNKKIEIALLVFEFLDYKDGKNSRYFNKDGVIIHESYNLQKERNAQESCPIGLELRERMRKSSTNKHGG